MKRIRTSMVLLALCVVAILAAWLRIATDQPELPTGSSYSRQADGAEALFLWAEGEGIATSRAHQWSSVARDTPAVLLVIQPEELISDRERRAFDEVARDGGTLVLAGDSLALRLYADEFDVEIEPAQPTSSVTSAGDPLVLPIASDSRVSSEQSEPLLVAPNGDLIAVRKPHLRGSLIVIATADPLTNAGLSDTPTARWVYREILDSALGGSLAFDEVHHTYTPAEAESAVPTVNDLLFGTAPGQAVVAATVIVFVYMLLAGRRLGPPLPPRPPTAVRRTMFEHVQMLAGLYRRAGQLSAVRATLGRHVTRNIARGHLSPARSAQLAAAVTQLETARTESELVAAVARADALLRPAHPELVEGSGSTGSP